MVAITYGYVTTFLGSSAADNFSVSSQPDDGKAGVVFDGRGGDDLLTGSAGSDRLTGGDGNDVIDGRGGVDTMIGGTGNDIYYVDTSSDIVLEYRGEGVDTVVSTATYTLNADVENLVLNGSAAIDGTGNAGDNIITGNNAANTLDGGAGGNDRLFGMAGDDILRPNGGHDIVDGGAGTDTIVLASRFGNGEVLVSGSDVYLIDAQGAYKVSNVEQVRYADRTLGWDQVVSIAPRSDAARYIASNPDLIRAFGTDTVSATAHYATTGFAEGTDALSSTRCATRRPMPI